MNPKARNEGQTDDLLRGLAAALARAVDVDVLRAEVLRCVRPAGDEATAAASEASAMKDGVLHRIVLADVLDDSILGARPGDRSFPLRMLFGTLGASLDDDTGFALASGLNFFFRAAMDEEVKLRLGLEVSRLHYRFATTPGKMERAEIAQASPLLAALMNAELSRVRFESVDHQTVFDSAAHEREPDSDAHSAAIVQPVTFLCRVAKSNVVRVRAMVRT